MRPLLSDHRATRTVTFLAPVALAGLLGLLWLSDFDPFLRYVPGIDAGMYLYIGQQMLRGAVPYRDLFDNKGPVLYFFNVAGLLLGHGSYWGVYVLEYCLLAAVTAGTWLVMRVRIGTLAATLTAVFLVLEIGRIAIGDHEEEYAIALQCLTIILLARRPSLERRKSLWFVAGLLAGSAVFLKPTTVGVWIAVVVAAMLMLHGKREVFGWSPRVLSLLCGACVSAAGWLAYLALSGALRAFFEDYVDFNRTYVTENGLSARLASLNFGIGTFSVIAAVAVTIAWVLVLRRQVIDARARKADGLAMIAVVWLPIEVVLALTSGYSYRQYYLMWVLPATYVLCFSVAEVRLLIAARRQSGATVLRGLAATALVIVAVLSLLPAAAYAARGLGGSIVRYQHHQQAATDIARAADYLRIHTRPGDPVLVWGSHYAMIDLLADRPSSSRYAMQMALYNSGWAGRGVKEFLADLKAHPPTMILDSSPTRYQGSAPSIASGKDPSNGAAATAWSEVYDYLHTHYRLAGRLPFAPWWPVYVPRDGS